MTPWPEFWQDILQFWLYSLTLGLTLAFFVGSLYLIDALDKRDG